MSIKWISAQPLIGGMSLGFEQEFGKPECIVTGFAGNDNQYINYTNVQRKLNVPVVTMDPTYSDILENSESKEITQDCLWVMVPICSGLSMLNSSTKCECVRGDPNNKQNQNMYNLTSLAMKNKASVIVFENAPALYTNSGKGVRERLYEIAKENGYSMGIIKTSTLLHGIPQRRERTFAMFYRDTNPAIFEFEHKPLEDYIDYLDKIPKDATYQDYYLLNDKIEDNEFIKIALKKGNFNNLYELYNKLKNDGVGYLNFFSIANYFSSLDEIIEETIENGYANKFAKKVKRKISEKKNYFSDLPVLYVNYKHVNAVISKGLNFINPKYMRYNNVRELLWLMGMPHDFQFSEGGYPYMLTQNVPVVTANYIARNIKKYYEKKLDVADSDYVAQNNIAERNDYLIKKCEFECW